MAKKVTPEYLKSGEGFVDVTLSRPVTIAGAKLSVLRMREPLVRDQKTISKMEGDNADKESALFANLCDLVPSDMDEMPMKDYARLQDAYSSFMS